jgi:uncharacterized protein YciI
MGIRKIYESKRVPVTVRKYLKSICDEIEWEPYKGHFILSSPTAMRTGRKIAVLNTASHIVYEAEDWDDAKREIDTNYSG